jgi:type IV pilus assembly protein PilA
VPSSGTSAHAIPHRLEDAEFGRFDQGFTLVELLIVILIIGILAAIAIPSFLDQKSKANDAQAESAVTSLRPAVASCFLDTGDYTKCDTPTEVSNTGLDWGTGPGQVSVDYEPYGIPDTVAYESAATDGTIFAVIKSVSKGTVQLLCLTTTGQYPVGNCAPGGSLAGYPVGQW